MHTICRSAQPDGYPNRFPVPEGAVHWSDSYPEYDPELYLSGKVIDAMYKSKVADPEDIEFVINKEYFSLCTSNVQRNRHGYPLNPKGRTGLIGRGLLYYWGANPASDVFYTRMTPDGRSQGLFIERLDTGLLALIGGHVDPGETHEQTATRETKEEAGFYYEIQSSQLVYSGYVDDPRNTDNAWMETKAYHVHLPYNESFNLSLKSGSDAKSVGWYDLTLKLVNSLYATHGDIVLYAANKSKIKLL
jgi:ADP-ribose pyrophosphatase